MDADRERLDENCFVKRKIGGNARAVFRVDGKIFAAEAVGLDSQRVEVLAGVDMSMAAGIAVVAGDDRTHTDGISHLHVRHVFAHLDSGADSLVKGDDREGHEPVSAGEHLNVSAADANAAHFEKHLSVSALRGLAFGHDSFFGFRKHDSPHAFALFLSRTRRAAASMAEAVRP